MVDVLFVAPDLHRGGVGRCVSFIVDQAPTRGVSTALFVLRGIDHAYTVQNSNVSQGMNRADSRVKMLALLPFVLFRLMRTIAHEQPQIVCSHGLLCNLLVGLIKLCTRVKFKSVAFEHNSPTAYYNHGFTQNLKRILLSSLYRQHDRIAGVSKGVVEDLERNYPHLHGRCHTIYNGVSLDAVQTQSKATVPHEESATASGKELQIVALGRLDEVKDYPTLIKAAALLDDPGLCFTIVGSGPAEAALRTLIEQTPSRSRVCLLGHLDNPYPVVASASLFVLTSRRESFGMVLIEALALGVPIIATNCPFGPAEILDDGQYGVLVPVGDPHALAASIRDLVLNPARRTQLSMHGPERAREFSLDQHCQNIIDLFHPLLRSSAMPRSYCMVRIPVSVVVMTKNEERNIAKCLRGLADFDEVFVIDSNSTDQTCQIASAMGAKVVNFTWNGRYPKKKQWCLKNLPFSHTWVLYVDADEEMTPTLSNEIRNTLARIRPGVAGAFVAFDYVFCGKKLEHGHRVYKLVLLDYRHAQFLDYDDLDVTNMWEVEGHYQPVVHGSMVTLKARMIHNDHDSLYHYFDKHNRYSDWEANLRVKGLINDPRAANVRLRAWMKKAFDIMPFKAAVVFIHSYIVRLGFLDGKVGFDYAVARAMYYWQIKLKIDELKATRSARASGAGASASPPPASASGSAPSSASK